MLAFNQDEVFIETFCMPDQHVDLSGRARLSGQRHVMFNRHRAGFVELRNEQLEAAQSSTSVFGESSAIESFAYDAKDKLRAVFLMASSSSPVRRCLLEIGDCPLCRSLGVPLHDSHFMPRRSIRFSAPQSPSRAFLTGEDGTDV